MSNKEMKNAEESDTGKNMERQNTRKDGRNIWTRKDVNLEKRKRMEGWKVSRKEKEG